MQPDRRSAVLPGVATEDKYVTSSARSMKVDNVNRLIEAVRSWDAFDMEKMLQVASDIAGYEPETDRRYRLAGRAGRVGGYRETGMGFPVAGADRTGS